MKIGEPYWGSNQQRAFDMFIVSLAQPALWAARWALQFSIRGSGYGPIFYQQRVGTGSDEERLFEIEKLQTLDATGASLSALAGWYRRYGIDELSQLENVRRRQMSIAGPRSLVPKPIEGSPAVSYEEAMDNLSSSPNLQKRWDYVIRHQPSGIVSTHGLHQHTIANSDQYIARAEMDIQDSMDASVVHNLLLLGQYTALAIGHRL